MTVYYKGKSNIKTKCNFVAFSENLEFSFRKFINVFKMYIQPIIQVSTPHCKYIDCQKYNFSWCNVSQAPTSSALWAFNYCPKYSG